jgi:NTE family protein
MAERITGVFEGGGVKGIALAGAAAAALDEGYQFDQTVGTSAGAMVASLVSAGFGPGELRQAVTEIDWPGLTAKSALRKNVSMIFRLGFHSGSKLEAVLRRLLGSKGVRSFGDLPDGSLMVVATDLNHGRGIVLPNDLPGLGHDPRAFSVARAVLMSSSVPFVFEPVRLSDRVTGEELMMADGAITARFPAQLVPRNPASVGFRLRPPPDHHPHHEIKGPVSLATAVIGAGISAREDLPPMCGPLDRVVEVVVDHDSLDFDVSPALAAELFDIGYAAALKQLSALSHGLPPIVERADSAPA